jgi:hypothetical protein
MAKIKRKQIHALFAQGIWSGSTIAIPSANSVDVSAYFIGKSSGGTALTTGILTQDPYNRIDMRLVATRSALTDDVSKQVYGRLSELAGAWTIKFYVVEGGADVPFDFTGHAAVGAAVQFRYCEVVEFKDLDPLAAVNYGESVDEINIQSSGTPRSGTRMVVELAVTVDGQTVFVLPHVPSDVTTVVFAVNGLRYTYGADKDYTVAGDTLTWLDQSCTLEVSDSVTAEYTY